MRMRTTMTGAALAAATLAVATLGSGIPTATAASAKPSFTIGSQSFGENEVLGYVYGDALKAAGFSVSFKPALGVREVLEPALDSGKINFTPEYLGAFLDYLDAKAPVATVAGSYGQLKPLVAKKGLVLGNYSAASDADAIAVTQANATKYRLKTIADLKKVASKWTFGGPPECKTRITCVPGLKKYYGVTFKSFKSLDEDGPITVAALKNGQVQAARIFSSDVTVNSDHFVVLSDPKDFQGSGNIVPVMQKSVATPATLKVINRVSAALTTADLVGFNIAVANHTDPTTIAQQFVAKHKL